MSWVAAAAAGGAILGAIIQSQGANSASNTQAGATREAIDEQRRQFNIIRDDTAPWRNAGGGAVSRLAHLLGIPPTQAGAPPPLPGGGGGGGGGGTPFVPGTPGSGLNGSGWSPIYGGDGDIIDWRNDTTGATNGGPNNGQPPGSTSKVGDPNGPGGGHGGGPGGGDDFGRLNNRFSLDDLKKDPLLQSSEIMRSLQGRDPSELNKKFSEEDFWNDSVTKLGFQFGLDEGRRGLNNMAGASGMRRSGQTLKALTKFGTDYTGTKAEGAYNRFEGEQDELMRRFGYADTMRLGSYDRFSADNDRDFNRLATVAGLGTTATGQSSAAGATTGANIGNLLTAGANARGAASIAQGNIWGNAVNNVGQWWNLNNRPNQPNQPPPFYGTGGNPY